MSRRHIDCRHFPSESNCTIAISADSEDELIDAAAQHAVQVHGHLDSPELRTQLRQAVSEGEPVA
jgi:predicted small metal-binding protein